MSNFLIPTVTGDVADGDDTKKTVRGPCTIFVAGTFGAAIVYIAVGPPGGTREVVMTFSAADDAAHVDFADGKGRGKLIDMPIGAQYDVSASINGTGDHSLSVAIIN